jgi:hypothetical protein
MGVFKEYLNESDREGRTKLVHEKSGKPLAVGAKVKDFRGGASVKKSSHHWAEIKVHDKPEEPKTESFFFPNVDEDGDDSAIFESISIINENDQNYPHHLPLVSAGKINTQKPEKHEHTASWDSHGGSGYARVVHHTYGKRKDGTYGDKEHVSVIAGGHDMKPGDHVHLHDDGNRSTKFPGTHHRQSNAQWRHGIHPSMKSGERGVVTHVAKHSSEMKQWPAGKHRSYAIK